MSPPSPKIGGPASVAQVGATSRPGDAKAAKLLSGVAKDIGFHEVGNNGNPYTRQMGIGNAPWCAAFVSVKLAEAGITGYSSASCAQLMSQFRRDGKLTLPSATPQPCDVIFFGNPPTHTGFVTKVEGDKVYTTEGNSSDAVSQRVYDKNDPRISGYGKSISEPVSSDIADSVGIDSKKASTRGGGSSPAARAQGRGSSGQVLDTGQDANSYRNYSSQHMLETLLAILRGDREALFRALCKMFPGLSVEDVADMGDAILENPGIAAAMLRDPQGTVDALADGTTPSTIVEAASAQTNEAPLSADSVGVLRQIEREDLGKAGNQRFEDLLSTLPKLPSPPSWGKPAERDTW